MMTYLADNALDDESQFPAARRRRETMINNTIGAALAGTVTATAGGWTWAAMWLIGMV